MKFYFYTLGCKVNQYETSVMQKLVADSGHTLADGKESADVIVINSCTVTAESDRKTRQAVRRFKRNNPTCTVVLTGCLPQAFKEDAISLNEADILLGNGSNHRLIGAVEHFFATGERVVDITPHKRDDKFCTPTLARFPERTRAYIKIQDGCERYCTYCIIPTARGWVRSKSPDVIKSEVAELVQNGHKEIVLVGINLSTYGKDLGLNLCDAVDAAASVEGVVRVRLGSLEPDLFTDEMLSRLANQKKLCPQFHLALQSGCDATLHRMNRRYDTAFFADLVARIRKAFPNSSITTDIMVGFVGETEDEFNQSVEFVKQIGFARSHVFAYSRRAGTPADRMKGHLENSVKEARSKIMIDVASKCEQEFLQSQAGLVCPVLFEQRNGEYWCGYTPNYTQVMVKTDDGLQGLIKNVKITKAKDTYCTGEIEE